MPAIHRLYNLCRESLSPNGPVSEQALERIRAFLGNLQPSDVGLEEEAEAAIRWITPMHEDDRRHQPLPPISYLRIHECESFTIGIFCMPPSSVIPLHDHPEMTVLSKLLYGSMYVKAYDWVDSPDTIDLSEAKPATLVRDTVMTTPCDTMTLYPASGGNIHSFHAITPCAIFDILSPPYSSQHGRYCTYYHKSPGRDLPGYVELDGDTMKGITWLEEFQPPDDFVIERGVYRGPCIRI